MMLTNTEANTIQLNIWVELNQVQAKTIVLNKGETVLSLKKRCKASLPNDQYVVLDDHFSPLKNETKLSSTSKKFELNGTVKPACFELIPQKQYRKIMLNLFLEKDKTFVLFDHHTEGLCRRYGKLASSSGDSITFDDGFNIVIDSIVAFKFDESERSVYHVFNAKYWDHVRESIVKLMKKQVEITTANNSLKYIGRLDSFDGELLKLSNVTRVELSGKLVKYENTDLYIYLIRNIVENIQTTSIQPTSHTINNNQNNTPNSINNINGKTSNTANTNNTPKNNTTNNTVANSSSAKPINNATTPTNATNTVTRTDNVNATSINHTNTSKNSNETTSTTINTTNTSNIDTNTVNTTKTTTSAKKRGNKKKSKTVKSDTEVFAPVLHEPIKIIDLNTSTSDVNINSTYTTKSFLLNNVQQEYQVKKFLSKKFLHELVKHLQKKVVVFVRDETDNLTDYVELVLNKLEIVGGRKIFISNDENQWDKIWKEHIQHQAIYSQIKKCIAEILSIVTQPMLDIPISKIREGYHWKSQLMDNLEQLIQSFPTAKHEHYLILLNSPRELNVDPNYQDSVQIYQDINNVLNSTSTQKTVQESTGMPCKDILNHLENRKSQAQNELERGILTKSLMKILLDDWYLMYHKKLKTYFDAIETHLTNYFQESSQGNKIGLYDMLKDLGKNFETSQLSNSRNKLIHPGMGSLDIVTTSLKLLSFEDLFEGIKQQISNEGKAMGPLGRSSREQQTKSIEECEKVIEKLIQDDDYWEIVIRYCAYYCVVDDEKGIPKMDLWKKLQKRKSK